MICKHCIYFFDCVHLNSIISSISDLDDFELFECPQFYSIYRDVLEDVDSRKLKDFI